jgi:hypothetical protein
VVDSTIREGRRGIDHMGGTYIETWYLELLGTPGSTEAIEKAA